jgi:hypothetical protein
MSEPRFAVVENGAIIKIQDSQDNTVVCYMRQARAIEKTLSMAKVMVAALNEAAQRQQQKQCGQ